MSYCRFSSDDWRCDVYVYEASLGGWATHVAANKRVGFTPIPTRPSMDDPGFRRADQQQARWLKTAWFEALDLPHAGESFNDASPGDCADRLDALRSHGFRVPQRAIDALRSESREA